MYEAWKKAWVVRPFSVDDMFPPEPMTTSEEWDALEMCWEGAKPKKAGNESLGVCYAEESKGDVWQEFLF